MRHRSTARRLAVLVALTSLLACGRVDEELPPAPPTTTLTLLPPLDGPPPDCRSHPHLCGLPLVDLGGGHHPRAFQIVFIGDGFTANHANDDDFAAVVARLHRDLLDDGGVGPVAFDPDLFHFWRVDLESAVDSSTTDDERRDTPLGAGLLPPDSCAGRPFIDANSPRVHLALDEATRKDAPADNDDRPLQALRARGLVHAVVVAADSTGRANADVDVRMSSFDGVDTLRHELGHALFELADEYAEFDACPRGALVASARATDGDLVHRPNVQRSTHPAKWQGLSSSSVVGGERVPCLHHASDACLMAGTSATFCAVCARAIDERLDLQRCGDDDREPPRVAIDAPLDAPDLVVLPGGSRGVVRAVVDDTRDGDLRITWLLDGELVAEGAIAELDLVDLDGRARTNGHALSEAVLVARAVDRHGLGGESRPLLLDEALPGVLEVLLTSMGGLPGLIGVRVESVRPFDLVEVKTDVETVVVDSGPGGTATVAIRVPLVGGDVQVTTRSPDGRLGSGETRLGVAPLLTTSTTAATAPLLEVAFAAGSNDVPLGNRALLMVEVRSCVAVLEVGVIVDEGQLHLERVAPRRAPACVDGERPAPVRYAVDVDDARASLRPVVVDVSGRRIVGEALPVTSIGEQADGCFAVDVDRPKSAFDPVDIVATGVSEGDGIVSGTAVVGDEILALRTRAVGLAATLHPIDLEVGDRLRVALIVRCDDGTVARSRRDLNTGAVTAAIDLRPPVMVAPLHAPRGGGLLDVVVVDDRGLAAVLVDGVPARVEGAAARLQVAPGARVEARDAVGLVSTVVVGEPLPGPRVPSCE